MSGGSNTARSTRVPTTVRRVVVAAVSCALALSIVARSVANEDTNSGVRARTVVHKTFGAICKDERVDTDDIDVEQVAAAIKARVDSVESLPARGPITIVRSQLLIEDTGRLRLDVIRTGELLRQIVIRYSTENESATPRPILEVVADADCRVSRGREILYEAGRPRWLTLLDTGLAPTANREPFDPVLDAQLSAQATMGTPVAVIDSGVDYRIDKLRRRLYRQGDDGELVGYDFWDQDALPFDANPARSPFYPERHGTRIASIISNEAPVASIAPYRYPRPDPTRFAALIEHIGSHGIRIANVSMGSRNRDQWTAFRHAVTQYPNVLFIVSAGNNGRDIDVEPVYPASFPEPNILSVTSADADGSLAAGSNWGREAVDIMAVGEGVMTTEYGGVLREVSGSSYAAARVSALAACLLADEPTLSAAALKKKIIDLALSNTASTTTRFGFLAPQLDTRRGGCEADLQSIAIDSRKAWLAPAAAPGRRLPLTAVLVQESGWETPSIAETINAAMASLAQCDVVRGAVELVVVRAPPRARILSEASMQSLAEAVPSDRVRVFFVEDTLREVEFGAEAVGRVNARNRPDLRDSVWMTRWVPDPHLSLAHELYHVLADSGLHRDEPDNLMSETTRAVDDGREIKTKVLTDSQCGALRNIAAGNGLIED